jgi:hypothetical protein
MPLHVSSNKCSSSGGPNCINTSYGITHSGGWLSDVPVKGKQVSPWPARQTSTFYEDLRTSTTVSCSVLLKWEMFQTKVVEKIKTQILCSKFFFRKSCRLWHNVGKCGKAKHSTNNTIRRILFACWITKSTDTHSEYVILTRQQWLRQSASMLCCTYIACLYIHVTMRRKKFLFK